MSEVSSRPTGRRRKPAARRGVLALAALAMILGGALTYIGWPEGGPTPISSFDAPNARAVGDDTSEKLKMGVEDMADNTIFVPSLDIYAPIVDTSVSDGELTIPGDAKKVGWDTATADLSADIGSTFLAGHVRTKKTSGALSRLTELGPGARIFTKDEAGTVREWVAVSLEVSRDKVMDAAYFDTSGERRLTIVTCTGPVVTGADGRRTFRDSAIATAIPVEQTVGAEPTAV